MPTLPHALRTPAVLAAAGLVALAVGCSGPRPPAGAVADPVMQTAYPAITVDGSIQNFVAVDYTKIIADQATEDRPLSVQVPLRSQADNEMTVQYQFTWFDGQGRQVGETGWRTATLPSRRQMQLQGNAITRSASQWRLDVRSAR